MKIVHDYPPNHEAICRAIPGVRGNNRIIYTYGATLYVPGGEKAIIPDHLMAHEETHTRQQGDDIEGWWERYLADPAFRLSQEVEAYRVQWAVLLEKYDRGHRRRVLAEIVKDLAGSMYGNVVDKTQARKLITGGSDGH